MCPVEEEERELRYRSDYPYRVSSFCLLRGGVFISCDFIRFSCMIFSVVRFALCFFGNRICQRGAASCFRSTHLRSVAHPYAPLRLLAHPSASLRIRARPCASFRILARPCASLRIPAHPCASLRALVYPCAPLRILQNPCAFLRTIAHPCAALRDLAHPCAR